MIYCPKSQVVLKFLFFVTLDSISRKNTNSKWYIWGLCIMCWTVVLDVKWVYFFWVLEILIYLVSHLLDLQYLFCSNKSHHNKPHLQNMSTFLLNERTKSLTVNIGQTDDLSFLMWMWDRCLHSSWAQVRHADSWHALHRRDEEMWDVNWDAFLSHAIIH